MQKLLDKINIEKNNITSILSTSALGTGASFIMVLAFANLVSAQTLGTYQYIISLVSIIGAISLTGILTSIIRAVSKGEYSFLGYAKKYLYLGSIPAAAIGTTISSYYLMQGNYLLAFGIFVSNFLYLGVQILYRFNAIYIALNEIKIANILLKLHAVAPAVVVLPALFFIQEAHLLVVLYFCSTFLAFIVGIWLLKMRKREDSLIALNESVNDEKRNYEHLKFGFHQSVITVINTAAAHMDKILIFQMLGAQQTAVYFIAVSIPDRFRSVIKQFDSYIFARFAKHSFSAVRDKMATRFLLALLLILPFYVAYVLLAPILFTFFLPQYENAIILSQIYALTLFAGALIIPQSILKAHGETKHFYMSSVVYSIVKPSIILFGIVISGLYGAIIATTIALLSYMLLCFILALHIEE